MPTDSEDDQPSTMTEQLHGLTAAGFVAHPSWIDRDLVVLIGNLHAG